MTDTPLDRDGRLAAARDPQSPPSLLRELLTPTSGEILLALGNNPNTPPDLLLRLSSYNPDAILENPALELIELESPGTWTSVPREAALRLLARPRISGWFARQLLASREITAEHRLTLAGAPSTPDQVLLALAEGDSEERREVAGNLVLPAAIVARLACDPQPEVRAAVARSTGDAELLRQLAEDEHPRPRHLARSRLEARPAGFPAPLPFAAGGSATDCGPRREHNEDESVCGLLPGAYLAAVIDGMGGHHTGEIAARIAAGALPRALRLSWPFAAIEQESSCLGAAVIAAHEAILQGQSAGSHAGMGATIAALLVCENRAHIAHVGDSRVYRLRRGSLEQITQDHTLISDYLASFPELTEEQRAELPRNVITRALGIKHPKDLLADQQSLLIEAGDLFLLSTDGLHDTLTKEEMRDILQQHAGDAAGAARALVAAAVAAQCQDNVTVVVVDTTRGEGREVRSAADCR